MYLFDSVLFSSHETEPNYKELVLLCISLYDLILDYSFYTV